jgi:hypothetical protein
MSSKVLSANCPVSNSSFHTLPVSSGRATVASELPSNEPCGERDG